MELQASRFAARVDANGDAVLLADQDRRRMGPLRDRPRRGAARPRRRARPGPGPYQLQAAIALCHAEATTVETTDWDRIVLLYEMLGRVAPSPVVELNRAVAVSMASGASEGLALVEALASAGALRGSHLIPSVRGELLSRLGRRDEARAELRAAAALTATRARRRCCGVRPTRWESERGAGRTPHRKPRCSARPSVRTHDGGTGETPAPP